MDIVGLCLASFLMKDCLINYVTTNPFNELQADTVEDVYERGEEGDCEESDVDDEES